MLKSKFSRIICAMLAALVYLGTVSGSTMADVQSEGTSGVVFNQTEDYGEVDFSSKRILVSGDIIDPENELSGYDGVHLMQYADEQTARNAYAYYDANAAFVAVDNTVSVAAGDESAAGTDEMTQDSNPITELSETASGHQKQIDSNLIALIDTGVNGVNNVIESVSMTGDDTSDNNGHGTKLAKLIAETNADARIISIKALGKDGTGDASAVYAAIVYAMEKGAGIINLSITAPKKEGNAIIAEAVQKAIEAGCKVVAAAGNNGKDASYYVPASLDGVITTGAADEGGVRLEISNYGSCVNYNVIADSTSEAAAIYSALLSAGKGSVDNKVVFEPNHEADPKAGPDIDLLVSFYDKNADIDKTQAPKENTVWIDGLKVPTTLSDGMIQVKILGAASDADLMYGLGVYTDFANPGVEVEITKECTFDKDTQTVYIPEKYADAEGLTVRWYESSASDLYNTVRYSDDDTEAAEAFGTAGFLDENKWNNSDNHKRMSNIMLKYNQYTVESDALDSIKVNQRWEITSALTAYVSKWTTTDTSMINIGNLSNADGEALRMVAHVNSASGLSSLWSSLGTTGRVTPTGEAAEVSTSWLFCACNGDNADRDAGPAFYGGYIVCLEKGADNATFILLIDSGGQGQDIACVFKVNFKNIKDPVKASVTINKTAEDTKAPLSGAVFGVYTDQSCADSSLVKKITTDENGTAKAEGLSRTQTYYIKELEAPQGYALNSTVNTVTVPESITVTGENGYKLYGKHVRDNVYTLELQNTTPLSSGKTIVFNIWSEENGQDDKYAVAGSYFAETNTYYADIPLYRITENGEYIIHIYDGSNYAIGKRIYVNNTSVTCSNDPIRGDLELYKQLEETRQKMSNIPFKITNVESGESRIIITDENGYAATSDGRGALSYGSYIIDELPSDNNYGTDLIKGLKAEIKNNNQTVSLGILEDKAITISTEALSAATGTHTVPPGSNETVVETVNYSGLTIGREYVLESSVVDYDTKEVIASKETTLTPSSAVGKVEIEFEIETSKLAGKQLVVFEKLYDDGSERQKHEDINDKAQTLYIPSIETSAADINTNDNTGRALEEVSITDHVTYTSLEPGIEYTVNGTLMDKATGEAVLDTDGKEITSSAVFTPESANGTVDITFTFNGTELEGSTIVIFEGLYYGDIELAVHADIANEGQTVYIPKLRTSAVDIETKNNIGKVADNVSIADTVAYENLIIGNEYVVRGTLVNTTTKETVLDENGKAVSAGTTFTAEAVNGTAEVIFNFDSTNFAGESVTVYEELYYNNVLIAQHKDTEDTKQTIHYPEIHTSAAINGSKQITAGVSAAIVDTVAYKNLIPGVEYTVKGTLMNRNAGKDTGITAETSFIPETSDGTVDVTFNFDSTNYADTTLVVYEKLYACETEIVKHEDIDDEAQAVFIAPQPKAQATTSDKNKVVSANTGDTTDVNLWIMLAVAGPLAAFVAIILKKREH